MGRCIKLAAFNLTCFDANYLAQSSVTYSDLENGRRIRTVVLVPKVVQPLFNFDQPLLSSKRIVILDDYLVHVWVLP